MADSERLSDLRRHPLPKVSRAEQLRQLVCALTLLLALYLIVTVVG